MKIGPYEATAELGRGGMGVVFRARAPGGQEVALKVLLRLDAEKRARFDRERRLLGSLGEAKGFVPLLDAGTSPQGPYVVMPLLTGRTLRERLDRGPQTIEATVALGRALARAVGEAHALGIVHRDLKPENVLFSSAGQPLVADLGLAKHFAREVPGASQSRSLSRSGDLRGTAGYMAPEQLDDAKAVGPAADVFALGAILYECLAGRPPFAGGSTIELLACLSEGTFEPLARARPDVPGWLERVVTRALAADPRRRFSDGAALAAALAPDAHRSRGPWRPIAFLASLALVAALGAVASTRRRVPPTGPPPGAVAAPDVTVLVQRGAEARARRDLEGAAESLSQAVRLDPGNARAWELLGLTRQDQGRNEEALAAFSEEVRVDPGFPAAWIRRGSLRVLAGDRAGALADAERAVAVGPKDPLAWSFRGSTRCLLMEDLDEAIRDCDEAIRLDPSLAPSWVNRAGARSAKGDHEGAVADFTEALRLDPADANAWNGRGFARQKLNDRAGASADYTESLRLDPASPKVWLNRSNIRGRNGDHDGAIADASEALKLDPTLAAGWLNLGSAYGAKGDREQALRHYARFLEVAPDHPKAPALRAEVARLKKDLAKTP